MKSNFVLFKYSVSLLILYLLEKCVNKKEMLNIYLEYEFVDFSL